MTGAEWVARKDYAELEGPKLVVAFRLCNIAEKSAGVFMTHMSPASKDREVRKLAAANRRQRTGG